MTIWDSEGRFLKKAFRRSKSVNSVHHYQHGIDSFHKFCDAKKVTEITEANIYSLLDDWVGEQDEKGLKPQTVINNVSAVRRFLAYNDIFINRDKFKAKVTLPRTTKIADEPLSMDTVRTLLTKGRPNKKSRALILTLLSSGMRIGEALHLRWKDVDLSKSPATLNVRAEYTKTGGARVAYVSDEARESLLALKGNAKPEELVFFYSGDHRRREKMCNSVFRRLVKRSGIDSVIENHRTHVVHFHSFRKAFFTKAADTIGETAAHALIGHGFYMDTYYKKTEEERVSDYKQLEPLLTTSTPTPVMDEAKVEAIVSRASVNQMAGILADNITEYDQLVERGLKDPRGLFDEIRKRMHKPEASQRLIPVTELKEALSHGERLVQVLPDGKQAVVETS
jgi:integrase